MSQDRGANLCYEECYGDMVIMSMEIYESTMRQIAMYRDIEISEKQIEAGQIKDARTALRETRAKYGL